MPYYAPFMEKVINNASFIEKVIKNRLPYVGTNTCIFYKIIRKKYQFLKVFRGAESISNVCTT